MYFLLKFMYRFNAILIKIPTGLLLSCLFACIRILQELFSKFIWKSNETRIAKISLKKNIRINQKYLSYKLLRFIIRLE